jgi:hypothetical protein
MNRSVMTATLVAALSALSFSAQASSYSAPAVASDQVVASFERLLTHRLTPPAIAAATTSRTEIDHLRAYVNAVLWQQPSYHLPATCAAAAARPLARS